MDRACRFNFRRLKKRSIAIFFDLVAVLRLSARHCNAEGVGLVVALVLADNARRWLSLPAEVRAHIEQRERELEPELLSKVVGHRWREGISATLHVVAANTLGADVGGDA